MTTNSKEYQRAWYAAHREERRAYFKEHNKRKRLEKSNPKLFDMREDYKAEVKEKFQSIPKKELTYSQRYYIENREKIRAQQKESRKRKKMNAKQREYYAANREHLCELQRKNYARKQREKRLSKTFLGRLYLKIFG